MYGTILTKIIKMKGKCMGQEGYGITIFILGIILLPLFFLFGGAGGLIFDVVLFGFLLIRHARIYYNSPSVIKRNIDTSLYKYGREYVKNNPGRQLTSEEEKYNDIRCLIYEIAYQTALKNGRTYLSKHDYKIAVDSIGEVYISDYGVYCNHYLPNRRKEQIYIIEFSSDIRNEEPKIRGYIKNRRFLYRK